MLFMFMLLWYDLPSFFRSPYPLIHVIRFSYCEGRQLDLHPISYYEKGDIEGYKENIVNAKDPELVEYEDIAKT